MIASFTEFVERIFRYVENTPFIFKPHHHRILKALDDRIWGRHINDLIIATPPRSGKTSLVSLAIAYSVLLAKGRSEHLICAYATSLSNQTLNRVAAILNAPGVLAYTNYCARITKQPLNCLEINNGQGLIRAISPTSSCTGFGSGKSQSIYPAIPASALMFGGIWVDDLANSSESYSTTINERNKMFFDDSLSSRKNNKDAMSVIVAQVLSVDDIISHVADRGYETIRVPALLENETSFWEERYPAKKLLHMRDINPVVFYNQFQQIPEVPGNVMMKEAWIHTQEFDECPVGGTTIATIDMSGFTNNDNSAMVIAFHTHGNFKDRNLYVVDCVTNNTDYVAFKEQVTEAINHYSIDIIIIENASSGTAIAQDLKGSNIHVEIRMVNAKGRKAERFGAVCSYAAQGKIVFNSVMLRAKPHFLKEIKSFTSDGKAKYADICDCMGYLCSYLWADQTGSADNNWIGNW